MAVPGLADAIAANRKSTSKGVVWEGPSGAGDQGGVTQSMLGRYLADKEAFRVMVIKGLKSADKFEPRMEFGNMWHVCEEALSACKIKKGAVDVHIAPLQKYATELMTKYPLDRTEIGTWANKCADLFPHYVEHWRQHKDEQGRKPWLQEEVFDVSYLLPSNRRVRLRGKWDAVDKIDGKLYIQENKTKSSIDVAQLNRQLHFDLQTMLYVIALREMLAVEDDHVAGVRYNVIRRSAHRSSESMLKKLGEDREDRRMGEWFARWRVEVSERDCEKFKRECLDPVLDNLLDDYEWWTLPNVNPFGYGRHLAFPKHVPRHYRFPYGIYAPAREGGTGDMDSYLATGSTAGLRHVEDLFPELRH